MDGAVTAPVRVVAPGSWAVEIDTVIQLISSRFARAESVGSAVDLIGGLVANLERKNCWTIAEQAGHDTPDRLQHLLARAVWDVDGVRDDLAAYVVDRLAEPGEASVLVVDETGDLKKGDQTVGVQRQYTGTAGRVENAQVAVFATLVTGRGHTFIDRALYLPKCWVEDPERRADAGVPADVDFATKPALAATMTARAVTAGVPVGWVTGDEVYGACPGLRATIRSHDVGYVLAVASNHRATASGADEAATAVDLGLATHDWERLSAGHGAKGRRYYTWARCPIEPEGNNPGGHHWILFRRNDTTGEWAYYRCWHPNNVPLDELVRVAGQRWRIEETFQAAKGHVGLDQHQVRRWNSWHRWTTLAMLAHALLTVIAADARDNDDSATGLIPITLGEARRILTAAWQQIRSLTQAITWSRWRRQHQHRARQSHYHSRGQPPPPH